MKVAVVAEFYPRHGDPVLGVWAHRQALAAQAAGAEVHVFVLHRLVPPRASLQLGPAGAMRALGGLLRQWAGGVLDEGRDGLPVTYVPYVSPPRERSYHSWGDWAAPALGLALRRLRRRSGFDLLHAHNAVPAGEAVRRAGLDVPLVVSVHGGDVLYTAPRSSAGGARPSRAGWAPRAWCSPTAAASPSSPALTAPRRCAWYISAPTSPVQPAASGKHHRTAPPEPPAAGTSSPVYRGSPARGASIGRWGWASILVTVGHLVARKRHADVLRALAVLAPRHPTLRYVIVGDGPERVALEGLAARLGVGERVHFCGQLAPAEAIERARRCTLFVMPSTEEAFGVAYIEAMAGGLPAIGCRGEPGPEEIAAAGDGFMLVPPGDIERLTQRIDELLSDPQRLREAGRRARATVAAHFTWERCGEQTLAAYEHVLR